MMPARSLRRVLVYKSMLASILPFVLIAVIGLVWVLPQIRNSAETSHQQLAMAIGLKVEGHLESASAMVRAIVGLKHEVGLTITDYQNHLEAVIGATDAFGSIYLVAEDGRVVSLSLLKVSGALKNDLMGLNLSSSEMLQNIIRSRKAAWSETYLSVIDGGMTAAYGVPDGQYTVVGEVDLAQLSVFLKRIATEKDTTIFIIDRSGQILADNSGTHTAQQLNIGNIELVRIGISSDVPVTGRFSFEGRSMTGSILKAGQVGWYVMVARPDSAIYKTSLNIALIVLAGIPIALACSLLTSFYQAGRLASRFEELNQHAQSVAEGAAAKEWPESSITEFNRLSGNLQQMAGRIQASELLYRTLFDESPDGVILWGLPELKILECNEAAHNMLGYSREEFSLLTVSDMDKSVAPEMITARVGELEKQGVCSFETMLTNKFGEPCYALVTLKMLEIAGRRAFLAIHRDITRLKQAEQEQRNLEKQMLHAQKLESLGVLAGGIAHDFNNILMAIIGNADLAKMRINRDSPAYENLAQIDSAAYRAADLAKQMLAYSGKGRFLVENINLNRLLEEMLHMLKVSISKKAELRLDFDSKLPLIEADATQIRQVVMNLVINASEALGENPGEISISTGSIYCESSYLKAFWMDEDLPGGLYVCLEVTDNGCGMDKETISRIFEPFFTTKFTGRGLGMAAVLGIVRGHRGAIRIYSEPGKGTSFKLLLPASAGTTEPRQSEKTETEWRGSGKVLLVDDEETVRGVGTAMLAELGFDVITACEGCEAVGIYKANQDISFVVLDLTMPRMDGEQCFYELQLVNPAVKVIVSSGFNRQEVISRFTGTGQVWFVQKPYRLSVLQETIRDLMSG
jgi:PAS domain S-box-containing protein